MERDEGTVKDRCATPLGESILAGIELFTIEESVPQGDNITETVKHLCHHRSVGPPQNSGGAPPWVAYRGDAGAGPISRTLGAVSGPIPEKIQGQEPS